MTTPQVHNPFRIAQRQLDDAARILRLDPAMHAFLREPMRLSGPKPLQHLNSIKRGLNNCLGPARTAGWPAPGM